MFSNTLHPHGIIIIIQMVQELHNILLADFAEAPDLLWHGEAQDAN